MAGGDAREGFQYPLSDRTHCNLWVVVWLVRRGQSFSILYRIEPTVTAAARQVTACREVFQYPLSDRTHCNQKRR